MSNDLIPLDNLEVPEYLRGFESELSNSMVTQAEVFPRISLRGRQFRFKKDGEETSLSMGQPLKVVVLLADPLKGCGKSFYQEAYSSDSDDSPDCSSSNGIVPDSWVDDPQCSSCAQCPNSEWGSAVDSNGNPGKGKACSDVKRLFVVPPNAPTGDMYILQVPPASLKALSNYGRSLAKHRIPVEAVVTEVQFVDSEFPQVEFKFAAFLPETSAKIAMDRSKSDEMTAITNQSAYALPAPTAQAEPDGTPKWIDGAWRTGESALRQEDSLRQVPVVEGQSGFGSQPDNSMSFNEALDQTKRDLVEPAPQKTPAELKREKLLAELAELDETPNPGGIEGSADFGGGTAQPEVDAAGVEWDANLHAANKAKTGKGFWSKLRGAKKPEVKAAEPAKDPGFFQEPETQIPADAGGDDDLSSILDTWGGQT